MRKTAKQVACVAGVSKKATKGTASECVPPRSPSPNFCSTKASSFLRSLVRSLPLERERQRLLRYPVSGSRSVGTVEKRVGDERDTTKKSRGRETYHFALPEPARRSSAFHRSHRPSSRQNNPQCKKFEKGFNTELN